MTNKYRNKKTVIDNVVFHSMKEAARYGELKLLLKAKKIAELKLQPRFKLYAGIVYVADFMYFYPADPEQMIVEDVKGYKTAVYQMKKKMFLEKYPAIKFIES